MGNVLAFQKGKTIGYSNPVISTKGSAISSYISIFCYRKIQTVFQKIMCYICTFLTHHIHMSLKDHCR